MKKNLIVSVSKVRNPFNITQNVSRSDQDHLDINEDKERGRRNRWKTTKTRIPLVFGMMRDTVDEDRQKRGEKITRFGLKMKRENRESG